ncbi:SDR family NAD(P)-dependent oxidoreductase [Rothia sp. AR01]|uniref:SDR family NAD(P)-dependent oxidoreductase n=1 Tax=Rothia santali TaxID=2949643 RepID=A0A9X2KHI0_9MICC|nr:SDR family NAD(P)-dependent oxidoreductase [Rothia santali]MCP3425198.1 SDR family NAD(P)-dependent oxidoreductase [Rothia santali]
MSRLTAHSTIQQWIDSPIGGPLIDELLTRSGVSAESLSAVAQLPLQQLVPLSQGKLPQSVVDHLVSQVHESAEDDVEESSGWQEQITRGRFAGQTVVVTGAASGIGQATASRVAREGGRVIAADISAQRLNELAMELAGLDLVTVEADITRQESVDAIVSSADGRIDALANVAGINDDFSPLHETSDAMWEKVMAINLTGIFKLTRAVIPLMLSAGRGSVVNVASEASLRGNASGSSYTASKHGVVGLTKSAAFMYGPQGIRVNAVAPGGVATGIPFPANISATGSARLKPYQAQIPTLATAQQLASSITFLLSHEGVNLNGVILPSDGGWSIQ